MVQHWFAHPIRGNPSCDHGRLATPLCRESGVADSCGKECQSGRERAAFRIFFHRRGLHRGRRRYHRGHNFVAKRRNCFQKSPARLYCPRQPKGQRRLSQHRHLIMRTDLLVRRTRMHFPRFDVAEIKIAPINKGGSDRKFYRIHCSPDQTLILVKYNLEREENRHYVQIADFLDAHDIRVPKIYFHDPTEGLIWIEDLGESDLYSYRHESWLVRRAFYESASLLFDPYVDMSKPERDELICYYREKQVANGRIIDGEFDDILRLCAMQRLMQALGAYGFLGLVKSHKHFLKHVPAAMTSLAVIVSEIGGLEKLNRALIEPARKEAPGAGIPVATF